MKKFLILLLLLPLSGCVTYYTPEVPVEDGVYYADEDPAYINNAYVSGSYVYPGAAYYPWWSMDYFYLGYRPYGYGGYGAYVGGGFSIGISYGYSPWYYPYYSYFSPWHYPYNHYAHNRHWRRHGDYCQPYNACGRNNHGKNGRGDHDRYAGNDRDNPTDRRNRGGEDEDGNEDPGNRRDGNRTGNNGGSPVRRYVSTAPSGYSGNQGMVIRSSETTKTGKHRVDPAKTDPVAVTDLTPSVTRSAQPVYRSRQDGRAIRYRSSPKQGRARTGPVDSRPAAGSSVVAVAPAPVPNYRSRQGGNEIRYRSGAKQGKSRTDPVRSASPNRGVSNAVISSGTGAVPVQRSGDRQSKQAKTTRQVSGTSRSDASSRPPSRSGSRGSVSHGSRSNPTPSSSGRSRSSRSHSRQSRHQN